MDELIADFLAEASEGIQALDNKIVELEKNPDDAALIGSIFRVMHTIKGTCGFLGLDKLGSIAHAGENIMDKIRNKQLKVSETNISAILAAIDAIKDIIAYIGDNGKESDIDYTDLIKKINLAAGMEQEAPNIVTPSPIISPEEVKSPTKTAIDSKNIKAQTIKVSVDVLENLMQIVSELVLNRNQLIQLDRTLRDARYSPTIQRLNLITSSLQETVMETRMQPIGNAWIKLPRMVRDLSQELDKKLQLIMVGEDTELDRQIIESIKDPLTHMIRNSADHGIESKEDRLAAGKDEIGTITLKAYHQGGHIIIEFSDDGGGLDIARIKSKAVQKGLASEDEVKLMSDVQATQFIFKAGFSTSETITEVSGRGVGMDVVRSNIENIRGTIDMRSVTGKGITFIVKIPLTLAIMPILVVQSSNQKFGLPQLNIVEVVKANEDSGYIIEQINEHKILRLRDSLLPLISLAEIFKLPDLEENNSIKSQCIIVCEVNGENFGLIIDKIYDTEEIVLKPVSKLVRSVGIYSGTTLLGSGDVIMIIDPVYIAKFLNSHHHINSAKAIEEQDKKSMHSSASFLVLKSGKSSKAIPLELVSRLEEIDVASIENTEDKMVVQYHGSLMYLFNLNPKYKIPDQGMQQIVVFINKDHILGLIVEDILDIVEQDLEDSSVFEDSDLSAIVLDGKTMDIIDVNHIFNQVFHSDIKLKKKHKDIKFLSKEFRILLVDDSSFFLKFFPPKLRSEGFEVSTISSAIEALIILEKQKFDLIITDINMPHMDGFEFAKLCSNNPKLADIPLIALTSNSDFTKESQKLAASGIKACISKTSYDELIELIYSLIDSKGE